MEKCSKIVYDSSMNFPRGHHCKRDAGYGRGGLFCKTHAKSNPAEDATGRKAYAIRVGLGVDFVEVQVLEETPRTAVVRVVKTLSGYSWFSNPIRKNSVMLFDLIEDGIKYVEEETKKSADNLRARASNIETRAQEAIAKIKKSQVAS